MVRLFCALAVLLPSLALAGNDTEQLLVIKDHRFTPSEVHVPAGKKVKLVIDNQDTTPEEFDSHDLNREKVIMGNSKGVVFIGPLNPGRYSFMGEFNAKTAQGVIIAE